jgi:hypothetical protein
MSSKTYAIRTLNGVNPHRARDALVLGCDVGQRLTFESVISDGIFRVVAGCCKRQPSPMFISGWMTSARPRNGSCDYHDKLLHRDTFVSNYQSTGTVICCACPVSGGGTIGRKFLRRTMMLLKSSRSRRRTCNRQALHDVQPRSRYCRRRLRDCRPLRFGRNIR